MYRIHTGRLNRTSPTVSHRGDENNKQAAVRRWQAAKKYTACGRFVGASTWEAR